MEITKVKNLINRVEDLGSDTQPLRDLLLALKTKSINFSNISDLVNLLDEIVTSSGFAKHSNPMQVSVLLKQIKQSMVVGNSTSTNQDNTGNNQNVGVSTELLAAILEIKSNLNDLKNIKQSSTVITRSVENYTILDKKQPIEIEKAFVNPIDDVKVDNIKANITFETKAGSNLDSKLSKLKNFKKG